jgi:hypothetical protein
MMAALCGPVRNLPQGNGRGEAPVGALAELELADESFVPPSSSLPESEATALDGAAAARAMHYRVQFTADQEYMSLLDEARDLLSHVNPTRDFVEVQRRALEVLVAQLRQRKHAARAGAAAEHDRTGAARDRAEASAGDRAKTSKRRSYRIRSAQRRAGQRAEEAAIARTSCPP